MSRWLVGLLSLIVCSPAFAEPSAAQLIARYKAGAPDARYYLIGVYDGLGYANAALENGKKPVLFCLPNDLHMTTDKEVELLGRYIAANPDFSNEKAGSIILRAFRDAYPCQ